MISNYSAARHHDDCTVDTDEGKFVRWPGHTTTAGQWWDYTHGLGGRPTLVTVPDTIRELERIFDRMRAQHAVLASHWDTPDGRDAA